MKSIQLVSILPLGISSSHIMQEWVLVSHMEGKRVFYAVMEGLDFRVSRKEEICLMYNHLELWARSNRGWVAAKDPHFRLSEVGLGRGRNIRRELFLMCHEHPSIRGRSCWVFFMPWVHSLLLKRQTWVVTGLVKWSMWFFWHSEGSKMSRLAEMFCPCLHTLNDF